MPGKTSLSTRIYRGLLGLGGGIVRLLRLPLDLLVLTRDVLVGSREWAKGLVRGTPRPCPFCSRHEEFPRSSERAEKYGNWWVLKTAAPCLRGPSREVPDPHCRRASNFKWPSLWMPVLLLLLLAGWSGAGYLGLRGGRVLLARVRAEPPEPAEASARPTRTGAFSLDEMLEAGRAQLEAGQLHQARITLLNAAKEYPTNAVCQLELGRCLLAQEQYPTALGHFLKAEQLDPELAAARLEIADLYFVARRHDKVIAYLEKSRDAWEGRAEPGLKLAQALHAEGRPDAARRELDAVLAGWEREPPEAGLLLWAGRLLTALQDPERATRLFNEAVERHPDHFDSRIGLAAVLISRGKAAEAAEALDRAEALDPDSPKLEIQRIELDILTGGPAAGIAAYRDFIGRHPDRADVKGRLAELLMQLDRFDEATEVADAMSESADRAQAVRGMTLRARMLFDRDMYGDAIQAARKALLRNERDPGARFVLAQALFAQGKYQQAIVELVELREIAPEMEFAGLLLGRARHEAGLKAESLRTYEENVTLFPNSNASRLELANFHYLEGNLEEARGHYEAILDRAPGHRAAANNLAQILADLDRDLDRAYQLAADLYAQDPENPLNADLLGWVLFRQGRNPQALKLLDKAVEGLPGAPAPRYHLAMALHAAGKSVAARRELEIALSITGRFTGAGEARALLAELRVEEADEGVR